jgi:glycosyltransferase involved in cell wall biosynthesis
LNIDQQIITVIPCFNEESRLDIQQLELLLEEPEMGLLLVDDGSTDKTKDMIMDLTKQFQGRVELLPMHTNVGKAEAVRAGMQQAIESGATHVGFADADFATPAEELLRLSSIHAGREDVKVLLGSRILRLGAEVSRSRSRHYVGRFFATLASMILDMGVYDTQCGAKFFEVTDALRASLIDPFFSRWAFDVELIARLKYGVHNQDGYADSEFLEIPLESWDDKSGSKISFADKLKVLVELVRIAVYVRSLRMP